MSLAPAYRQLSAFSLPIALCVQHDQCLILVSIILTKPIAVLKDCTVNFCEQLAWSLHLLICVLPPPLLPSFSPPSSFSFFFPFSLNKIFFFYTLHRQKKKIHRKACDFITTEGTVFRDGQHEVLFISELQFAPA